MIAPVVRLASVEDAPAIARIQADGWRAAYRGILPDGLLDGLNVEQRARMWETGIRERQAAGVAATLVARMGGTTVGFASVGPARDDGVAGGELYAMYVAPDRWRAGIGTTLMPACIAFLRSRLYRGAILWVLEANEPARRFYERHGWRADGARKGENERLGTTAPEVRYSITFDSVTIRGSSSG